MLCVLSLRNAQSMLLSFAYYHACSCTLVTKCCKGGVIDWISSKQPALLRGCDGWSRRMNMHLLWKGKGSMQAFFASCANEVTSDNLVKYLCRYLRVKAIKPYIFHGKAKKVCKRSLQAVLMKQPIAILLNTYVSTWGLKLLSHTFFMEGQRKYASILCRLC